MIDVEVKLVWPVATTLAVGDLSVRIERNKASEVTRMIFSLPDREIVEDNFSFHRLNYENMEYQPAVEIVQWRKMVIVLGYRKWLIFHTIPTRFVGSLILFRSDTDDQGFYKEEFHDHQDLLVAVYESGVTALSEEGTLLWHYKKHWDDLLREIDSSSMVFDTFDEKPFALDVRTGATIPLD